jgi:hypothetical protein
MGSLTTKNKTANTGLDNARQNPPSAPLITGPFELSINNSNIGPAYADWTLSSCSLRITDQPQADRLVILKKQYLMHFLFRAVAENCNVGLRRHCFDIVRLVPEQPRPKCVLVYSSTDDPTAGRVTFSVRELY